MRTVNLSKVLQFAFFSVVKAIAVFALAPACSTVLSLLTIKASFASPDYGQARTIWSLASRKLLLSTPPENPLLPQDTRRRVADPKVMFQYLPGGLPLELKPGASLTLNTTVQ